MKTKHISTFFLCLAAMFTACETSEEPAGGGQVGTPLAISNVTVTTAGFDGEGESAARTTISGTTTTFETGDAIGMWAYKADGTAVYSNKKWVRQADGSWSPATADDNIYYAGIPLTIRAYYPYDATATSAIPNADTFTVQADQSDFDTGYEASDLLLSSSLSWSGTATAQTLTFGHAMALLEVASTKPETAVQSVTVGAKRVKDGAAETVTLYPVGDGSYRALLPAQTLAAGVTFNYSDTESYYFDLAGTTLTAGQYARYGITTLRGISTAAELQQFRDDWNSAPNDTTIAKWSHDGTATGIVRLLADIDMSSVNNFTPIGNTSTNAFSATFDGCGYTISNLRVSGVEDAGLFGNLRGGTVRHLTLANPQVSGNGSSGGIAGYVRSSSSVSDCSVSGGTVIGTSSGGIAGFVESSSSVSGCSVSGGSVSVSSTGLISYSGGIAGSVESSSVAGCSVSGGSVSGDFSSGGIAGRVGSSSVTGCSVSGWSVSSSYSGGIAGFVESSSVAGCVAAPASVSGNNDKGVAAGYNYGTVSAVCYVNNLGVNAIGFGSGTNLMGFGSSTFGDFFTTDTGSGQTPIEIMNAAITGSGYRWVAQGSGVLPKCLNQN